MKGASPHAMAVFSIMSKHGKGDDDKASGADPGLVTAVEDLIQHFKDGDADKAAECLQEAFDIMMAKANREEADDEDSAAEEDDADDYS